jgi:hypothetical protein
MNWKRFIIVAFVILVFTLLFFPMQVYWLFYPHTQNDVIQQVFKNREIFLVVQNPQTVTAQLLHSKDGGSDKLDGYTKDAPVGLSPEEIQGFQNLLKNPKSYRWGFGRTCIQDYGVLLNFRSQGDTVHVALCFKCNMLGAFEGDDDSAGQINRESIFDPMRPQLVALAKEIFPNDKEIQGLQ